MLKEGEFLKVSELFEKLGCTQLEANIYIMLLEYGSATVQEVARALKKNRVTVYSGIERLLEKGFLFETRKNKRRTIVAEDPSAIRRIIQKNENDLNAVKNHAQIVEQILSKITEKPDGSPVVKFYEGLEGLKKTLEETLEAKGEMLVFSYVDLLSKLLGFDYLEDYFKRRAEKNIYSKLILPPCDFTTKMTMKSAEYKIEIRTVPPELLWRSGIFIWNDSLATMSYRSGRLTCTIVEDVDIVHLYRNIIFPLCWNQAKKIEL